MSPPAPSPSAALTLAPDACALFEPADAGHADDLHEEARTPNASPCVADHNPSQSPLRIMPDADSPLTLPDDALAHDGFWNVHPLAPLDAQSETKPQLDASKRPLATGEDHVRANTSQPQCPSVVLASAEHNLSASGVTDADDSLSLSFIDDLPPLDAQDSAPFGDQQQNMLEEDPLADPAVFSVPDFANSLSVAELQSNSTQTDQPAPDRNSLPCFDASSTLPDHTNHVIDPPATDYRDSSPLAPDIPANDAVSTAVAAAKAATKAYEESTKELAELRARLEASASENSALRKRVASLTRENRQLRSAVAAAQTQATNMAAWATVPVAIARKISAACAIGAGSANDTRPNVLQEEFEKGSESFPAAVTASDTRKRPRDGGSDICMPTHVDSVVEVGNIQDRAIERAEDHEMPNPSAKKQRNLHSATVACFVFVFGFMFTTPGFMSRGRNSTFSTRALPGFGEKMTAESRALVPHPAYQVREPFSHPASVRCPSHCYAGLAGGARGADSSHISRTTETSAQVALETYDTTGTAIVPADRAVMTTIRKPLSQNPVSMHKKSAATTTSPYREHSSSSRSPDASTTSSPPLTGNQTPALDYVLCRDSAAAARSVQGCVAQMRDGKACGPPHTISLIMPASAAGLDVDDASDGTSVRENASGSPSPQVYAEVQCSIMSVARIPGLFSMADHGDPVLHAVGRSTSDDGDASPSVYGAVVASNSE